VRKELVSVMFKIKSVIVPMALLLMTGLLYGCGTIPHRAPLPEALSATAEIAGVPRARFWGDETPKFFDEIMRLPLEKRQALFSGIMGREHHYLALSGGGANGAFGAGLLVGWTAAGTRPEFTMVTGISTGALMAPFVFLGSAYDDELKDMYTKYATKDLVIKYNILSTLTGSSAVSTAPLRKMLAKYIDEEVRTAIAAEYKKGRRLYVSTTNLDAKRPVIWNIGLIAISDRPDALDLIHKIILASASIPAVFPPVLIEVEANGNRYDEIHVDGGTASQVFLYPAELDWRRVEQVMGVKGRPRAYVIRNSFLRPDWETVKPSILPIAGISIDSLIRTQGIGDMYRIYLNCQRDDIDYNLAYIPEDFDVASTEDFDPVYMGKLFQLGYDMAKDRYPWVKTPPGF